MMNPPVPRDSSSGGRDEAAPAGTRQTVTSRVEIRIFSGGFGDLSQLMVAFADMRFELGGAYNPTELVLLPD